MNRIDDIVIFNLLGRDEVNQIVDLQLAHLRRLLAERKIEIELTHGTREVLFRRRRRLRPGERDWPRSSDSG